MGDKREIERDQGEQKQMAATITVEDAARVLGVSRDVAYRAVESGEIPSLRLGRRILVPTAKLLAMVSPGEGAATHDPLGSTRRRVRLSDEITKDLVKSAESVLQRHGISCAPETSDGREAAVAVDYGVATIIRWLP